jgi:ketosteroid isomerase-like protein
MSTEKNKEIVRTFFEYGNSGDMDACLGLLSDNLVWTDVGTSIFAGTYEGKEKVLNELLGPLFSRLKNGIFTEIENIIAEGDLVVALSSGKAETLDGIPYNNSYCQIFKITEGKISQVIEYCDTALINSVFGDKA